MLPGTLWPPTVLLVAALAVSIATGSHFSMDTSAPVFKVDPEFLSVTLDFQMVALDPALSIPRWFGFGFNKTRIRTLLRGISPCYLRFGGTGADMSVFADEEDRTILYNRPTNMKMYTVFPEDIDNLVGLTKATGARLLYDLNINVRYVNDWDPNNALRLMKYIMTKGYADNVDFQLGNEPDLSRPNAISPWPWPPLLSKESVLEKQTLLTPQQIGQDFVTLHTLVRNFPSFKNSKIVGPDLAGSFTKYMPQILNISGRYLSATNFHHYYFNGRTADPSEYINPAHFDTLRNVIQEIKDAVKNNSTNKNLPVWNGETSDAYNSGTPNVSNRFISGFLWLDKLGLSAQMGVSVVTRQTFSGGFYGLVNGQSNPNPDYWLTYIHKVLVGRQVFNTTVQDASRDKAFNKYNQINGPRESGTLLVRMYAHCTKPSKRYVPGVGAVTVFGINLKNTSEQVTFDPVLAQGPIDQYILTPYGSDGLLSQEVAVNGKVLTMPDDSSLPDLIPVTLPNAAKGVNFPAHSFAFWVFPKINLKICSTE